jgi:putative sterol carrier protein
MATFGTIEVYEEMARLLNSDEEWTEKGREITYSMIFEYTEPVSKTFFLRFEEGKVTDVREIASSDSEPADFALSGGPDVWRALLEKQMNPTMAMARGKVKVKGNLAVLMKHMKAFNYILDSMSAVELV